MHFFVQYNDNVQQKLETFLLLFPIVQNKFEIIRDGRNVDILHHLSMSNCTQRE